MARCMAGCGRPARVSLVAPRLVRSNCTCATLICWRRASSESELAISQPSGCGGLGSGWPGSLRRHRVDNGLPDGAATGRVDRLDHGVHSRRFGWLRRELVADWADVVLLDDVGVVDGFSGGFGWGDSVSGRAG